MRRFDLRCFGCIEIRGFVFLKTQKPRKAKENVTHLCIPIIAYFSEGPFVRLHLLYNKCNILLFPTKYNVLGVAILQEKVALTISFIYLG